MRFETTSGIFLTTLDFSAMSASHWVGTVQVTFGWACGYARICCSRAVNFTGVSSGQESLGQALHVVSNLVHPMGYRQPPVNGEHSWKVQTTGILGASARRVNGEMVEES